MAEQKRQYKMVGPHIEPQVVEAPSALEAFKLVPDATAAVPVSRFED